MKIPTKILAGLGATLLAASSGLSSSAVYDPATRSSEDVVLIGIDEIQGGYGERRTSPIVPAGGKEAICLDGFTADLCDATDPERNSFASNILPICDSAKQENCVESFGMYDSEGNRLTATFLRNIDGPDFPADEKLGLHKGSTHSLWKVSGAPNESGSETYALVVQEVQGYSPSKGRFTTDRFSVNLLPYTEVYGPQYESVSYGVHEFPDGTTSAGYGGGGGGQGCAWAEDGVCGLRQDFGTVRGVDLVIRVSSDITGWFNGRLQSPSLTVEKFSETNIRISISAEAVEVPRFLVRYPKADLTTKYEAALRVEARGSGGVGGQGVSTYYGVMPGSKTAVTWINRYRDLADDKADGSSVIWNFSTIFFKSQNKCLSDSTQVLGLVTTNSSAFEDGPPNFTDGYLSYSVAGLHHANDGETLNLGTYDMVMRTDVARCLYGFSKAPVSATVQVVTADGEQAVASTMVSETDGWLKLAANNFTFSEKEIRVQVTQVQNKTLTKFAGTTRVLTSKQKNELKALVTKSKGNPKFICTGIYVSAKDKVTALKRARAACDYAKSLDKDHSYWAQAKQTKAKSYDGKVMVVSK